MGSGRWVREMGVSGRWGSVRWGFRKRNRWSRNHTSWFSQKVDSRSRAQTGSDGSKNGEDCVDRGPASWRLQLERSATPNTTEFTRRRSTRPTIRQVVWNRRRKDLTDHTPTHLNSVCKLQPDLADPAPKSCWRTRPTRWRRHGKIREHSPPPQ